ncbi:MAG: hypothetical protein IKJ58_09575 [Akkermansia sp.]|nr:hypothetical protein [Akkermansia sp.]
MKLTNRFFALALALAPLTAGAYQTAETVEQAAPLLTDDGYAIVMYATDWDRTSKSTADAMLADPGVTAALGNAVVMTLGVPNVTPKEEHDANKARFGNLDLSFPNVYPAIILYSKSGQRLTDICIRRSERNNPAAVAARIREAMSAAARQRELMAQAESVQGVERARLLGQASAVPGINRPNNIARLIEQADPDDASGMRRIAGLNLYDTAIQIAGTKDWEASLAEMKELLENPLLTTDQKQQVCCICIGLLHRHGGVRRQAELREMISRLRELNPDSILGQSATDAARLWVSELNLIQGWSPGTLPDDATPIQVHGDIPISAAGKYKVTFTYTRGTEALRIAAVQLFDGNRLVAEDRHVGSTGHRHSNNNYTLEVPATVRNPQLYVIFNMGSKRDSYGNITIEKL